MAQDTQAHSWPLWQAFRQWLPLFPAVLGPVDGELLPDIIATTRVLYYYEDGIWSMSIEGDGEAKLGRQVLLDVYPIFTGVGSLIDAAVILLV